MRASPRFFWLGFLKRLQVYDGLFYIQCNNGFYSLVQHVMQKEIHEQLLDMLMFVRKSGNFFIFFDTIFKFRHLTSDLNMISI